MVRETASAGEGSRAAREAAESGAGLVVACGGDGTVRSVAVGLLELPPDRRPALALAPAGRGNDLARALGAPPAGPGLVAALAAGGDRFLDAGEALVDGRREVFVNALGIGLDGAIARRAAALPLPGLPAYGLAAAIAVLAGEAPWEVEGTVDDEPFAGPHTLVSVGNSPSTGGGFRLVPDADPGDGLLDACLARGAGRLVVLGFLPRVLRGTHGTDPRVRLLRFRRLVLRAPAGIPVHGDGEVLAVAAREVAVTVLPGALRYRVPAGIA